MITTQARTDLWFNRSANGMAPRPRGAEGHHALRGQGAIPPSPGYKRGEALFAKVGEVLRARGLKLGTGTIVDATIIGAHSSTKNKDKTRDPEMHQTRKGKQYCFGMKMHMGVDSQTVLAHSAVVTAANVHDKHPRPDLLHGREPQVWGDSAFASHLDRIRQGALPRLGQERHPIVRRAGAGEHRPRTWSAV